MLKFLLTEESSDNLNGDEPERVKEFDYPEAAQIGMEERIHSLGNNGYAISRHKELVIATPQTGNPYRILRVVVQQSGD